MEPRSSSKLKLSFAQHRRSLKICITVSLIALLLVGIYLIVLRRSSYYTVVVDCGSTGTRVDVYEWRMRGLYGRNLPVLMHSFPDNSSKNPLWKDGCKYHCMQTEPGLDKYVGNVSGVRASLEPLIVWAEQQIPVDKHKDTPIFILATAGLRQLATGDSTQVLKDIEAVVKEHSFMFNKNWIRVLTGKEEAYYGWVALNYKMGSLQNSLPLSTLGLLDLGGSSLQVVMEVEDVREDAHFLISRIGSAEHRIFAYSLPSFGLNEAFDRTVGMLSEGKSAREIGGGKFEISHPCLSSSSAKNYSCNGCFRRDDTDFKHSSEHIGNSRSIEVVLVGDQNWERCKRLARAAAVNSSTSNLNCKKGLNIIATPTQVKKFHALSGFYAVYNTLNLTTTKANTINIWEKGEDLCSASFLDPTSVYAQYCFRVPYMASLIEDALCLDDADIYFGPGDVSWTLGAALVEWNHNHNHSWFHTIGYHTRISLFLFVLLLGLVFIVYRSQIKLPMMGRKRIDGGTSLPSYIYPRRRPN